jgi:hypothetical protein
VPGFFVLSNKNSDPKVVALRLVSARKATFTIRWLYGLKAAAQVIRIAPVAANGAN